MSFPPAYSEAAPPILPAGAIARRSIQDTRALILGNAAILKPRRRDDIMELVVAKHTAPMGSAEETASEQHYAFLVMRKPNEIDISIVVKGQPKDTIEEALEWMLDRTQTIMEEMLLRHGKHTPETGCCPACRRTLRPDTTPTPNSHG